MINFVIGAKAWLIQSSWQNLSCQLNKNNLWWCGGNWFKFGSGGPKLNLLTVWSPRLPPPKFTCTTWDKLLLGVWPRPWWNCHPIHNEVLENFMVPPYSCWPDKNINNEYLTLLLNWLAHFRGCPNGYAKHALKSF